MESAASLPNVHTPNHTKAGDAKRRHRRARMAIAITLWIAGLILLTLASMLTHNHPGPWPGEVEFTRTVQNFHYWPWIPPLLNFIGTFNNPTPTGIAIGILVTGMVLLGWYQQGIFFLLTLGIGNGLDTLFGDYVGRPRPSPDLVRVDV